MLDRDATWMRRALELAALAEGRTRPNPLVGAVLVRHGVCVGEGFHPKAGEPHAEVFALRDAGSSSRDATLYVTLEPCSHHGRTPPCADALIASGISRVVSAMEDPDRRVAGSGHARLRAAGIAVEVGCLQAEARRLNAAYLRWQATRLPLVTAKVAASLDGKTATRTGESKWITGADARREGHRLRSVHDAVLVGIGTVLADDPQLTARHEDAPQPTRIVLDSTCRTPPTARIADCQAARTVVAVTDRADGARVSRLERIGVEVWRLPSGESGVELNALLDRMGIEGVQSLLVEGGSAVLGSFVSQRLIDRVVWFIAPMVIGSSRATSSVGDPGFAALDEALRLGPWRIREVPPDVCLEADVCREGM
ncbi:bifunctional diaminohydroxyphosphoribosylaminopyrimidine deaminase/5-amino-6-(5-phosphoribosylamino)uracil reductase RibD [Candidatus Poribacteria bacterium]|nr:bifunctional diaminohydroxyphosphoribosylaminopyrimidine deaminase/5-amino-6-(5-phosphoribosylamino)uracil reductase RibD [Candidatus Poribacteria bacterium]